MGQRSPRPSHMVRPGTRTGTREGQRPGTATGNARQPGGLDSLTSLATRLGTPMYISDRALLPEEETLRLIGNLLQLPPHVVSTEDDLVAGCMGHDGLVTDPDFPPTATSLYIQPDAPPESAADAALVWRRVSGALYVPSSSMPQLLQGCLADGSFLGALAAVAVRPDLLLDLIVSDNQAASGCFTLQFFKHGAWHRVAIDNYLPCIEGEEKLAFACSAHVGELWPSLIEKAYAKLHGSFYSLEGGSVLDCLTDLTGGVATKLRLGAQEAAEPGAAGRLWHQLRGWLSEGAVVACKAKPLHSGHSPQELEAQQTAENYGVQLGQVYSVVETAELEGGRTRLVRVHCPWPVPGGVWQGPWRPGGPEWDSSQDAQQLAAQPQDPACAWLLLSDFLHTFNRVYACRRFPSSWHQLTLHCGWQGPSAGGPPYRAVGLQPGGRVASSTWCVNPQFQLLVRAAAEVVVAVGQVDPRMAARAHVPKSARKRSIGAMVLACPSATHGRVWSPTDAEVVAEAPVSAGREVVLSFRAQPGTAYIIVPYTGRPGEETAFVLRAYASSPLEVEQLPSPLSLVLGGSWTGALAGGPHTCSSWGSNPQYMLCAPCRTQVVASVTRLDMRHALIKPSPSPEQAVGVALCLAERSASQGLLPHKAAVHNEAELVAFSGYGDCEEASLITTLDPGTPYVLVPSLASPGLEAPFEVRLLSGVPLELVPLPELCTSVVQGTWAGDTAGGCDLSPSWRKNPRYLVSGLSRPTQLKVVLSRPGVAAGSLQHKECTNIDDMIGYYVLQASEPNGAIKGDLRRAVVAESTFTTTTDAAGECQLQEGCSYVVMPCKYGAGRCGKYSLAVSANTRFSLTPL